MFCKHCGKELADGVDFCQYCGRKQEAEVPSKGSKISSFIAKLSIQEKIWGGIYVIWFLLNVVIYIAALGHEYHPFKRFFPFSHKSSLYHYDLSEFIFYAILIPAVIYGICKLINSKKPRQ